MDTLNSDPNKNENAIDHNPREVFSGHYVPVKPTPIPNPKYISHSKIFFEELGIDDSLATNEEFMKIFSGDLSNVPTPMKNYGWATGYALSIYGTEYYQQCPFQTGNGYGDGRAISIYEGVLNNKRWEMQLKGGGRTPYCRGADGRAVLRSSIREFLAQEHMHALGIATSRSLSLYTSKNETVQRPWFNKGSHSKDPEVMIDEYVAITTRVAPSFLRVGQLELFARRARKNEHQEAQKELEMFILHVINREYNQNIKENLTFDEKVILLAKEFTNRITTMVSNWIRVGYCQGNFNSDNTALGGFTLDYGPFGFIDMFDPRYQPWTGGGVHFSFFNQTAAAQQNFNMFIKSLQQAVSSNNETIETLEKIKSDFPKVMKSKMDKMWADKLGLDKFDEELFNELIMLMVETPLDYTIFFRELSCIPEDLNELMKSFYIKEFKDKAILENWETWFIKWKVAINVSSKEQQDKLSKKMKTINPKYTLREWFLVPAYEAANSGNYSLIYELQEIMSKPYEEQSQDIENRYYRLKAIEHFDIAGISHVSCSS